LSLFVCVLFFISADDDSDAEGDPSEKSLHRVRRKKIANGSSKDMPPSPVASSNSSPQVGAKLKWR